MFISSCTMRWFKQHGDK